MAKPKPSKTPDQRAEAPVADAAAVCLTAAAAAERVGIAADQVLSFRDYGTHVVVVTTDMQKLTDKAAE